MLSLQELNDERDIKLVYCAYCDIIDAKDFDRLTEVFTTDAVQDYRSTLGPDAIMHGIIMHFGLGRVAADLDAEIDHVVVSCAAV